MVIYFVTMRDPAGRPLDGNGAFELHFPKDALSQEVVNASWSVHLVSVPDFVPVPNPLDRFVLSTYSNVKKNRRTFTRQTHSRPRLLASD